MFNVRIQTGKTVSVLANLLGTMPMLAGLAAAYDRFSPYMNKFAAVQPYYIPDYTANESPWPLGVTF